MMNRHNEEEKLTMVVKNLLPIYHKYLHAQYFPNFMALIAVGTQIEDALNNGTIKMKKHLNLKGIFGLPTLKLQKYPTYIKLIHTNSLP